MLPLSIPRGHPFRWSTASHAAAIRVMRSRDLSTYVDKEKVCLRTGRQTIITCCGYKRHSSTDGWLPCSALMSCPKDPADVSTMEINTISYSRLHTAASAGPCHRYATVAVSRKIMRHKVGKDSQNNNTILPGRTLKGLGP